MEKETNNDLVKEVTIANFASGESEVRDEEALKLICEFKTAMREQLGHEAEDERTKAVWFSKNEIRAIANYVNQAHVDGLRIYFGKYPEAGYEHVRTGRLDAETNDHINMDYNGHYTVVLVPTRKGQGNNSEDILKRIRCEDLPKTINKDFLQAYNHGELCPPKRDCRS